MLRVMPIPSDSVIKAHGADGEWLFEFNGFDLDDCFDSLRISVHSLFGSCRSFGLASSTPNPFSSSEEAKRGLVFLVWLPGVARYRAYPRLYSETPFGVFEMGALRARCAIPKRGPPHVCSAVGAPCLRKGVAQAPAKLRSALGADLGVRELQEKRNSRKEKSSSRQEAFRNSRARLYLWSGCSFCTSGF